MTDFKPLDGPTPRKLTDNDLLDNAACCSQDPNMLNGTLRECVQLNVINPLRKEIANLERIAAEAVRALESLRNEALHVVCYVGHDHQINADIVQKLDEQVDEADKALARIKAAGWEDKT